MGTVFGNQLLIWRNKHNVCSALGKDQISVNAFVQWRHSVPLESVLNSRMVLYAEPYRATLMTFVKFSQAMP